MPVALEVRGLWKSYAAGVRGCSARVSVLRGVSFRVARGERVGIVGAPGAGKTTLLHCIAGLRRPDAGEVCAAGLADALLLVDEGSMERCLAGRPIPDATLVFARSVAGLRGGVERVLLLRDGIVGPLDPTILASAVLRRVAEPADRGGRR
jgi:energy-coupling factor transporter ATP-binding protein EcfA2